MRQIVVAIVGIICLAVISAEARELARQDPYTATISDHQNKCRKVVNVVIDAPSKEILFSGGDDLTLLARTVARALTEQCAMLRRINFKAVAGGKTLRGMLGIALRKNDWNFQIRHRGFRSKTAGRRLTNQQKKARLVARNEQRRARNKLARKTEAERQRKHWQEERRRRARERGDTTQRKNAKQAKNAIPPTTSSKADLPPGSPCLDYDAKNVEQVDLCAKQLREVRQELNSVYRRLREHYEKETQQFHLKRIEAMRPIDAAMRDALAKKNYDEWNRLALKRHEIVAEWRQKASDRIQQHAANQRSATGPSWAKYWSGRPLPKPARFAVFVPGATCQRTTEAYKSSLEMLGFRGAEIDKRVPGCKVLATLFDKRKTPTEWSSCTSDPDPKDRNKVRGCIEKALYITWAKIRTIRRRDPARFVVHCRDLRGMYLKNVFNGNSKPRIEYDTAFGERQRPDCALLAALENEIKTKVVQTAARKNKEKKDRVKQILYSKFYEPTPERKKSRYSDRERALMKNGKIVLPGTYEAPTEEEVRLAVGRSVIDRVIKKMGESRADLSNSDRKGPTITDGRIIYFPVRGVPIAISFGNVKELACHKSGAGYQCQYHLGARANTLFDTKTIDGVPIRYVLGLLSFSYHKQNDDRFVLTMDGWRQPHTETQKKEFRDNDRKAENLLATRSKASAQRSASNNASVLGQFLHGLSDLAYARGVRMGNEWRKLR